MENKLVSKLGTTDPTRMILIEGRSSEADRAKETDYPPVQSKDIGKATTVDELYEIVNER